MNDMEVLRTFASSAPCSAAGSAACHKYQALSAFNVAFYGTLDDANGRNGIDWRLRWHQLRLL